MRWIAKAVAQDLVAAQLVRIPGQGVGQQAPALGHLVGAVLHVVGEPEGLKGTGGPVEIRKRVFHEPGPDIETDRHGHRAPP